MGLGHRGISRDVQTNPGENQMFPVGSFCSRLSPSVFTLTFLSTVGCGEGEGRRSSPSLWGQVIWAKLLFTEMAFY